MTDTKQPEALRLAETLEALGDYNFATEAAAELRRQHAEIESLRAKLDELEKQEHAAFVNEQGFIVERDDMQISSGEKLYPAAGARPVEPVQKLRPDFIAGYDAGMADAKRIQAHQPAPAAVVGPTNKVLWLLMAQYGLNMTVGQDMDNLLNFGRDVWNAALSTIQPTAQQERIHDQIAAEVAMAADKRRPT